MSVEEWERNNESFRYEPPDDPPELWSQDDYTELHDRIIRRRVQWICSKCEQPFGSLKKARRHVSKQHGQKLLERHIEG